MKNVQLGEYQERGEYHKKIDKNWNYYPTYLGKKNYILKYFKNNISKSSKILDLGCGEGVFIKELFDLGYKNIKGLDKNFSSDIVDQGDIFNTPYEDNDHDVILCLDVIEHLPIAKQIDAIKEMHRITKKGGICIISIPNLAHCYSRFRLFFTGNLERTARVAKHPGDRPFKEHRQIIKESGFQINKIKGLFLTLPFYYQIIQLFPSKTLWLYNFNNKIINIPSLSFLNIFICKK